MGNSSSWAITQIKKKGLRDFGAALGPEAAHHISVGSDTLALRMDRACSNAKEITDFLSGHPSIKRLYYPGLHNHPEHKLAETLFRYPGAIFSVELNNLDCFDFLNKLRLVICSSNLGDTRSLGIPVAHTIYSEMGRKRRLEMGIQDSLVRFSIGIEEAGDLIADFEQALVS